MPNVQIGLLPIKYVNDLMISNDATTPNTILGVSAGQARDSGNINDIILSDAVSIDFGVNGANGLDTGSIAASKDYGIYLLGSSNNTVQPSCMASLSLSGITSTFPDGYDIYKLIGYITTDSSAHIIKFRQVGNSSHRKHFYDTQIKVLTDGASQTLASIGTLTAIVPAVDLSVANLQVDFTPNTASDTVSFAPYGSTATVLSHVAGSVTTKVNTGNINIPVKLSSGVPVINYINSAASGKANVWIAGYEYYV